MLSQWPLRQSSFWTVCLRVYVLDLVCWLDGNAFFSQEVINKIRLICLSVRKFHGMLTQVVTNVRPRELCSSLSVLRKATIFFCLCACLANLSTDVIVFSLPVLVVAHGTPWKYFILTLIEEIWSYVNEYECESFALQMAWHFTTCDYLRARFLVSTRYWVMGVLSALKKDESWRCASARWHENGPSRSKMLTLTLSELVAQILAHKSLFTWGLWSSAAILQRWCGNKTSRNELCKLKVQNFLFHFSIHCSGSQLVQVYIPTRLSLFFKMSRDSAIIKFGYENHKEYEGHAAGNGSKV